MAVGAEVSPGLRALCFNHEKKTGDSQRAGRMPRYQMSTHVMRSELVISGVESVMERFDAIGKTLMRRAHAADFGSDHRGVLTFLVLRDLAFTPCGFYNWFKRETRTSRIQI